MKILQVLLKKKKLKGINRMFASYVQKSHVVMST